MSNFEWRRLLAVSLLIAVVAPKAAFAQLQIPSIVIDQSNRISVTYVPPETPLLQELYNFLQAHRALEQIQEILSPYGQRIESVEKM
jgi:hypothetical protein